MTNGEKIIITSIVVVVIAVTSGIFINKNIKNKPTKKNDEFNTLEKYFDNNVMENNTVENVIDNSVSENETNIVDNVQYTNQSNSSSNTTNNKVVGKEEEESTQGNNEKENENKAIELAKKEWGISVDSYAFDATLNQNGTYNVVVKNKTTTEYITSYTVNVATGVVTEN